MPLGIIAGAAVVGVGLQAYGAVQQGQMAGKQEDIAQQQLDMQKMTFGEQQGFETQLENLMKDPSSVSKLPGYQFQMDQGSEAVAKQMAATGYGGSGNEAIALTKFGQGMASSFYGQQAGLLAELAGLAPTSPGQYGANASGAMAGASKSQSNSMDQWNNTFQNLGMLAGKYGSAGGSSGMVGAAGIGAVA